MNVLVYIAHIRESDNEEQTAKAHLLGVKRLAEIIGEKLGVKHIAGLAGVLHDMGKYTDEFQTYLRNAVYRPHELSQKRGDVDHSTAGGKLIFDYIHNGNPSIAWILAEIVGNAVISHHSYLHDFLNPDLESDYLRRVRDKAIGDYEDAKSCFYREVMSESEFRQYVDAAVSELAQFINQPSSMSAETRLMFLSKYIFSALIDADRTDTRQFEENRTEEAPRADLLFEEYYSKLMAKIEAFKSDESNMINDLRLDMSEQCEAKAIQPSGLYQLSIPTGGGKTLASFRYALRHALQYGKRRIVYVVPYTTIIEQNADEIRRLIQDDAHLLEHHSNVVDDLDDDDEMDEGRAVIGQKLKLAKDNWDSPIIFTTMVQFLNVFFAKGSRNIRRLHNLAEAVIIFDEVQKVPVSCVSLFNQAVNFMKEDAKSSIVLCTATQPALNRVEKYKLALSSDAEMIGELGNVQQAFKRVEIVDRTADGSMDTQELAELVTETLEIANSTLVILNTKSVVKKLYRQLVEQYAGSSIAVYHLSTSMCASHRNDILERIKSRLVHGEQVICVSTQLIEAGVDISFECVIRSLAGLDSIAQAAGRCNRHGKQGIRNVYVIDHAEEKLDRLREIKVGKEIARRILIDLRRDPRLYGGNVLSVQAMQKYFLEFYGELQTKLNYPIPELRKDMTELISTGRKQHPYNVEYENTHNPPNHRVPLFLVHSYRTAARYFEVIDSHADTVLVPYAEGQELIAQLNGNESIEDLSKLLRKAQRYSINLFRHEMEALSRNGELVNLLEGKVWALKEGAYSQDYGLDLDHDSTTDVYIC